MQGSIQSVSNPPTDSKPGINAHKKLKWSKDGEKQWTAWRRSRPSLPPFLNRTDGYCFRCMTTEITTLTGSGVKVYELTIGTCLSSCIPVLTVFEQFFWTNCPLEAFEFFLKSLTLQGLSFQDANAKAV